ncbi:catechol 1,2-dioxygenase [Gramella sp. KN1008]|uniref:dioxygenase family protein n=1 Tax=Gramella sp. KN1008 TaxID=2529298 RepID=UPI0010400B0D|nr:catechol 1,2-dioxygenase [Gramella sp. KN1008]TBW27175.1 catechol 1,2-dioxygenase [Gramella sp. KN1008]
MKRRSFITTTSMTAFSIAAFGSISWNGKYFEGNTPTTSDILGPFYRPNAPMRSDLIPPGVHGTIAHLTGRIFRDDGSTALAGVLVEAWQCDADRVYDNTSDEFRFRGAVKTQSDGYYSFNTILPPPYNTGSGWRPAHIHMRISNPEHQDLITQIYFKDDPHLKDDPSSSSPEAIQRILPISKTASGEHQVQFDITMSKAFQLSDEGFKKVSGLYQLENGTAEFYRNNNLLMMRINGQIMEGLSYRGNNTFEAAKGVNKAVFSFNDKAEALVAISLWDYPEDRSGLRKMKGTRFLKY